MTVGKVLFDSDCLFSLRVCEEGIGLKLAISSWLPTGHRKCWQHPKDVTVGALVMCVPLQSLFPVHLNLIPAFLCSDLLHNLFPLPLEHLCLSDALKGLSLVILGKAL